MYFECSVRASPAPYKITWRHNGRELSHNVAKKVIISNQSLVLQKVTRADTGVYTCTAHNSEGDGVSNSINLNIKCKPRSSRFFLFYNFTTDIVLEPVCCKKRQKIVPDQLLVLEVKDPLKVLNGTKLIMDDHVNKVQIL